MGPCSSLEGEERLPGWPADPWLCFWHLAQTSYRVSPGGKCGAGLLPGGGGSSVEGQPSGSTGVEGKGSRRGKEVVQDQLNHPKPSMSVENTVSQEPMPGGDCKYMEDSKDHHNASHQGYKSKHFCPWLLGIRVAKENHMVKHWVEVFLFT